MVIIKLIQRDLIPYGAKMNRKRVFEIIEKSDGNDHLSSIYDVLMIIVIVLSLIPLAFKSNAFFFTVLDKITVVIFIVDYILHWMTADYKFQRSGIISFLYYPFSAMALVDLISILPSLTIVNSGFKVLRVLRMIRAMRVFRVFKVIHYRK